MNYSELVAKNIIEHLRPGCEMKYRVTQTSGEYDFDLICGNVAVAAIEVTMSTDPSKLRTRARILNKSKGRSFVKAAKCKKDWSAYPTERADPRKIRAHIDEYLAPIEATGTERFFSYTDAARSAAIH